MSIIIYPAALAFGVTALLGRPFIAWLRRLHVGQVVRQEGPRTHLKKSGTPTMGGLLMVTAALAATAAFARDWAGLWPALFAFVGCSFVGIFDDLSKLLARRSLGLKARHKLVLQGAIALVVALGALQSAGSGVLVPFSKELLVLPAWLYITLAVLTMISTSNAVNLTDGADGLAAGATAVSSLTLAAMALALGYPDVAVFAASVGGACLGFVWFNAHPAAVIMGDTGSLALGGALAATALLTRTPLLLVVVGGLYVIITLSVIIQVTYFRLTGGRRIFKMSPLHHHFELSGWSEPQVVIRFWLLALGFAALGLLAL